MMATKRQIKPGSAEHVALQRRQKRYVYSEWYDGKRSPQSVHAELVQLCGALALSFEDVMQEWRFLDDGARRAAAAAEAADQMHLSMPG